MPLATRTRRADRATPRPAPYTFECAGCEAVELRPTPIMPHGWVAVEYGSDRHAFCPGCAPEAIDLAQRELRFVDLGRIKAFSMAALLGSAGLMAAIVAGAQLSRWCAA